MEYNFTFPIDERPATAYKGPRARTHHRHGRSIVLKRPATVHSPLVNNRPLTAKRVFDALFALLVITFVLSWLIPILGLLIKAESRGPVFFKQLRTGKDDRPFYCYKLRSMHVNADADARQACKGDARITRVGAFIRKTNLDEMPQFFNVLLGDMSVVGPRPHMLKHTAEYSQVLSNFMQRHTVPPGITGLAQVRGLRGETKEIIAMVRRVETDIWYIKHWSFWLDLKIVAVTMLQTVRGDHNAF